MRVEVRDSDNSLDVARQVRSQIGVAGEIGYVNRKAGSSRISFPIESPGRLDKVKVDLAAGVATIEHTTTGAWDGAIYLHKMPGPHNVSIRGNWIFTRLWGWLADGTVYLLERASDGAQASIEIIGKGLAGVSMVAGTAVVVSVVGAGVVLSAAGQAIAFIPNALGAGAAAQRARDELRGST